MSFRIAPLLRQRFFTTSSRARTALPIEHLASAELSASSNALPKLGRIARWYLPTMALIAVGFGIDNALHENNRKVHMKLEPTQEQKNLMLMDMYGERSSLEDMERAIAGMETRMTSQKDKNKLLEEAYGDKSSIKDLRRAMEIYEVQ